MVAPEASYEKISGRVLKLHGSQAYKFLRLQLWAPGPHLRGDGILALESWLWSPAISGACLGGLWGISG